MILSLDHLVLTQDGTMTLRHPDYDEEFHSVQGARYEADRLYMEASGFRAALQDPPLVETWGVLDVGLGLGYNALMTIESWLQGPGLQNLKLVSLEQSPELVVALADPSCAWKKGWSQDWRSWAERLEADSAGGHWRARWHHPRSGHTLDWHVWVGDGRLADLGPYTFHYIWQDAFSPKKNPELWSIPWFEKLRAVSHPTVRLVSYSVARSVRDHLESAFWIPERVKTPPADECGGSRKKQWLLARLKTT